MQPESIAHYKIVGKIGQGGMGAVYRATDTKLNRDVAAKVPPDSFDDGSAGALPPAEKDRVMLDLRPE